MALLIISLFFFCRKYNLILRIPNLEYIKLFSFPSNLCCFSILLKQANIIHNRNNVKGCRTACCKKFKTTNVEWKLFKSL